MKITSHSTNHYQVQARNSEKNTQKEKATQKKSIQDSITLNTETKATQIKETNQAIGALQTMNKALKDLDSHVQGLISQTGNPQTHQNEIHTILDRRFNGKKVFDEDFSKFSSSIQINNQKLKQYGSHLNDTSKLQHLSQEIKREQNQTNKAISVLQNKLSNTLKTDGKDYNHLDTSKLNSSLAHAHNLNQLSLDRVSKLLA